MSQVMEDHFVNKILNKLFGKGQSSVQMLNSPLERGEEYLLRFKHWQSSEAASMTMNRIATVFWNVYNNMGTSTTMHVFKSLPANGFYFNSRLGIAAEEFDFILDEFSQRIIKMDYSVYTSDRKYKESSTGVERIDRHFLKPNPKVFSDGLINQNFGNVLLELSFINDRPRYLKCMVSIYSNRSFAEAKPFEVFAECLFSEG